MCHWNATLVNFILKVSSVAIIHLYIHHTQGMMMSEEVGTLNHDIVLIHQSLILQYVLEHLDNHPGLVIRSALSSLRQFHPLQMAASGWLSSPVQ